ncbi:hypothetical protein [Nibribacter koreensis]
MDYAIQVLERELKEMKAEYHAASPDYKGDFGDKIHDLQAALSALEEALAA